MRFLRIESGKCIVVIKNIASSKLQSDELTQPKQYFYAVCYKYYKFEGNFHYLKWIKGMIKVKHRIAILSLFFCLIAKF